MPDSPRAVVFDIGRVIIQWDLRHLFAKLIEDRAELDWFLANVVSETWHFQHDAGRPLDEMLPELKAAHPEHAALIDAYRGRFLETIPGLIPGTAELIGRLAARDVPLFALTNFGAEFWDMFLPITPVMGHFRDIVVSGVERCAKPDPAIYAIAERRFGFAPEALFFIDDNAANIAAARARGWQAYLFTGAAALERELERLHLLG